MVDLPIDRSRVVAGILNLEEKHKKGSWRVFILAEAPMGASSIMMAGFLASLGLILHPLL